MREPAKTLGKKYCVGCWTEIGTAPGTPTFAVGVIRCCNDSPPRPVEVCYGCHQRIWARDPELTLAILERIQPIDRRFVL